jgi:hypothetical protein
MEKQGEIREGLTPLEEVEDVQPAAPPEAIKDLLKEADARFKRLEDHMTTRSHTRVTDNLR